MPLRCELGQYFRGFDNLTNMVNQISVQFGNTICDLSRNLPLITMGAPMRSVARYA